METTSVIACLAFVTAFFAAAILLPRILREITKRLSHSSTHPKALNRKSGLDSYLRNGISCLKPLAKRAIKHDYVKRYLRDAQNLLEDKGLTSTVPGLGSLFVLFLFVTFGTGTVLGSSWVFGLILDGGLIIAAVSFINHCNDLRVETIREAVPDALRSMSVCSHVGLSLEQTFKQVASEIEGPLKQLYQHSANDLAMGASASEALERFQSEALIGELSFVAVALDVQHKAGGSLKQVLDAARDSIESELDLRRTLRIQTAQAKLSARIVSLMPFLLMALFSFLSPGFLSPFFSSIEGFALLGLAIIMQMSGILLVRRLLDVARD